jgi:hypothetical protein
MVHRRARSARPALDHAIAVPSAKATVQREPEQRERRRDIRRLERAEHGGEGE